MKSDDDVNDIRRRMLEIRSGLKQDVEGIRVHVRRLTDWHYYLARFPWASVAAAAAVGYLVIPKRPRIVQADSATLAKMAKDHNLVVQTVQNDTERKGMLAFLTSAATAALLRYGKAYATAQLQQFVHRTGPGRTGSRPPTEHANGRGNV